MLSTFEITIYATGLVLLLPILYASFAGSGVPESSWFAKYYRAERYLNLAGNLYLLTLCATADRQARPALRLYRCERG